MTVRTYNLTLDTFTAALPEPVIIRRGDNTGAVRIVATLKDNGVPINLTGKKLAFVGMTANNDAIVNDTAVTITNAAGGVITYDVNGALAQQAGKIEMAYFSIDGGTTFNVRFVVLKSADMSAESAKDYVSVLDELIGQFEHSLDDVKKQIAAIQGDVTDVENRVAKALKDLENGNFYTKQESDNRYLPNNNQPHNLLNVTNVQTWASDVVGHKGNDIFIAQLSREARGLPANTKVTVAFDLITIGNTEHPVFAGLGPAWRVIGQDDNTASGRRVFHGTIGPVIDDYTFFKITVDDSVSLHKVSNVVMYEGWGDETFNGDYGFSYSRDLLNPMTARLEQNTTNLVKGGSGLAPTGADGVGSHDVNGWYTNMTVGSANGSLRPGKHNFFHGGEDYLLILSNSGTSEVYANSNEFSVTAGQILNWGVRVFASAGVTDMDIFIQYDNGARIQVSKYVPSPAVAEFLCGMTMVPTGATSAHFRIDNNGSSDGLLHSVYFGDVFVGSGSVIANYRQSVAEQPRHNKYDGSELWGTFVENNDNLDDFMKANISFTIGYSQANTVNNPAGSDPVRILQTNTPKGFGVALAISGNEDKGTFVRALSGGGTLSPWFPLAYKNRMGIANAQAATLEPATAHLNDYKTAGFYPFAGTAHWENGPAGTSGTGVYGYLRVEVQGGVIFQTMRWDVSHKPRFANRAYAGNPAAWGPWYEITQTEIG